MFALLSIYGYYSGCELVAKWAFAHQTYFEADQLLLITLPKADLTEANAFLADAGEFEWQGQMVDVLHREVRSDTLYIYGFRDEAETNLKKEAAWLYQDNPSPGQLPDARSKRAKWPTVFILPVSEQVNQTQRPALPELRLPFTYTAHHLRSPLLEVPSPPPNSGLNF
ncbi:hypothetical protein [uncultured Fibrella sp.]|uniref:hypothetical protein n=1 Tax=uncultured Fibrella sp. TaxID=1284596 RepID=UPI0035CAE14A